MRERKFRLLSKGQVVGSKRIILGPFGRVYDESSNVAGRRAGSPEWVLSDDIQEFTGFTDADGVEIYEGDTVVDTLDVDERGEVFWDQDDGRWAVAKAGSREVSDGLAGWVHAGCRVVEEGE